MTGKASDVWKVVPGSPVDLASVDPASMAGGRGPEEVTRAHTEVLGGRLTQLHDRLRAERRRSLLLVTQAVDAGGKDGTIEHLCRSLNPIGSRVVSFRAPNDEELAHDFLWRVHRHAPAQGELVIFNRSHYEDVIAPRIRHPRSDQRWARRCELINHFEELLAEGGTRVVKLFLLISKDEQLRRFRQRVDDPSLRWKFRRADLGERALWDEYHRAMSDAIAQTSTLDAPWFVVPADVRWYRNYVVSTILVDVLEDVDPKYPSGEEIGSIDLDES